MFYVALVHFHTPSWDMVDRWSAVGVFRADNDAAVVMRVEELKRYWILSGFRQLNDRTLELSGGWWEVAFVARILAPENTKEGFEVFTRRARCGRSR